MLKGWAGLMMVTAIVAVGATPASASSHKLTGTITVTSGNTLTIQRYVGTTCDGSIVGDGYSDLAAGAQVVVRDAKNKIIATSHLGGGKADATLDCILPFSVSVGDTNFYSIEVSHRGAITYSKNDLDKKKWKVALSIGN